MQTITKEFILDLLGEIRKRESDIREIRAGYDDKPSQNSLVTTEQNSFPKALSVFNTYTAAITSIESASDNLLAMIDALESGHILAPWANGRVIIESCALAIWFLESGIDVRERVARGFAFRYKGIDEHIKLRVSIGDTKNADLTRARMNAVEQEALGFGYSRILDRNGKKIGLATNIPKPTDLVKAVFASEMPYRLLSAVAHSHAWAIFDIGFKRIGPSEEPGKSLLEKKETTEYVLYLIIQIVKCYTKALWLLAQAYGWELSKFRELFDQIFEKFGKNNMNISSAFFLLHR